METNEPSGDNTAKKNKPQPARAVNATETVIYLGPTIIDKPQGGMTTFLIRYGTIFKNGIPADVIERQKANPEFARLFLPANKAVTAMVEISKADSPLRKVRDGVAKARFMRRKGA